MNNPPRNPTLSEAVAGMVSMIIEMMLGLLRARGLRGLLELPAHFRLALELRRMAKDFVALFDAFKAGNLPPVAAEPEAAPEPEPALQEWQPAPARPAATPRAPTRARTRTRAARPRRARPRIAYIPRPCFGTPAPIAPPRALPKPAVAVHATGPPKNPVFSIRPSLAYFITIS